MKTCSQATNSPRLSKSYLPMLILRMCTKAPRATQAAAWHTCQTWLKILLDSETPTVLYPGSSNFYLAARPSSPNAAENTHDESIWIQIYPDDSRWLLLKSIECYPHLLNSIDIQWILLNSNDIFWLCNYDSSMNQKNKHFQTVPKMPNIPNISKYLWIQEPGGTDNWWKYVKIEILLLFSRVGGLKDVKRTFFPLHPNQG